MIIGCGYMGSQFNEMRPDSDALSHAAAYVKHPRTRLVGTCDADPVRARKAAEFWAAVCHHTDPADILTAQQPDIVSICTPHDAHAAHLDCALQVPSVRAVLCEKPLVDDWEAGQALVARAAERGVFVSVNYLRRFDPGHQRAAAIIASGELGEIGGVVGHYSRGFRRNGSHMLDLLRWLFGEATEVEGEIAGTPAGDVTASLRLGFRNGLRAQIHGHPRSGFDIFELDVIGELGRVRFERKGHRIVHEPAIESEAYPGFTELGRTRTLSRAMRDTTYWAVDDLVKCLDGTRASPASPAEDALEDLRVAELTIESARRGRPMAVLQ